MKTTETAPPGSLHPVVRRRTYAFYCLLENGTHIRYFGITQQRPGRRLLQHFADAARKRTDHRINWIRRCTDEGIHIDIHVLKSGLDFATACALEIRFIRFFRKAFNLVNTHRGGASGYSGLPQSSKNKHKQSCIKVKAAMPIEDRKRFSKLMIAEKAKHRVQRGESGIAALELEVSQPPISDWKTTLPSL